MSRHALTSKIAAAVIAPTLIAGGLTLAPSAEATTGGCRDGRCTIYLNKQETKNMAAGAGMDIVLSRLGGNPVLVGAVTALFLGHRLIAQQYANRGMCSAFRITIYPWEAQGYDGYRC